MKKKIYIAGKISGEDQLECIKKFVEVQREIEKQGFEAINPINIVGAWDVSWKKAMKICIAHLMTDDAVVFLDDYAKIRGAMIEHRLACELKIITLRGTRDLKERLTKQYKVKL